MQKLGGNSLWFWCIAFVETEVIVRIMYMRLLAILHNGCNYQLFAKWGYQSDDCLK